MCEEYHCTDCGKPFKITDFEYIGPINKDDTSCRPDMVFIYLCKSCCTEEYKNAGVV